MFTVEKAYGRLLQSVMILFGVMGSTVPVLSSAYESVNFQ
jgi:hypothetical protein